MITLIESTEQASVIGSSRESVPWPDFDPFFFFFFSCFSFFVNPCAILMDGKVASNHVRSPVETYSLFP